MTTLHQIPEILVFMIRFISKGFIVSRIAIFLLALLVPPHQDEPGDLRRNARVNRTNGDARESTFVGRRLVRREDKRRHDISETITEQNHRADR